LPFCSFLCHISSTIVLLFYMYRTLVFHFDTVSTHNLYRVEGTCFILRVYTMLLFFSWIIYWVVGIPSTRIKRSSLLNSTVASIKFLAKLFWLMLTHVSQNDYYSCAQILDLETTSSLHKSILKKHFEITS